MRINSVENTRKKEREARMMVRRLNEDKKYRERIKREKEDDHIKKKLLENEEVKRVGSI